MTDSDRTDWDAVTRQVRRILLGKLDERELDELDDLVQEATINVFRVVRREHVHNLAGLVRTVTRATWIDYVRRRECGRRIFKSWPDDDKDFPDPKSLEWNYPGHPQEHLDLIVIQFFRQQRLACLPLAEAYFLGRSWGMVARQLGRGVGAIRAQWHRCVDLLRNAAKRNPGPDLLTDWASD